MTPDELARVGLRVKPLEWQDFEGRGAKAQAWLQANYMIQKRSDGRYEISASHPGYSTFGYSTFIEGTDQFYPTLEAAKAAAQANYEARILAALRAMPVDPVAEAARVLLKMRKGIEADVRSAHQNRGNGASGWMTEDDREFRSDLSSAFDRLAEALAQEKPHD